MNGAVIDLYTRVLFFHKTFEAALTTHHGRCTVDWHLLNTMPVHPVALQKMAHSVKHIFTLRRRGEIFAQKKFFFYHVAVNVANVSQ